MWREALLYARMPMAAASYVRAPRVRDPLHLVRDQLEHRLDRFLETVQRVIFDDAASPYRRMFDLAGCQHGDLVHAVRRNGLEDTLGALRRDGVFLTHEEFKGRTPIVRSGRHVPAGTTGFRNPLASSGFMGLSSGSGGAAIRTYQGIDFMRHSEAQQALVWNEFELGRRAHGQLHPILPSLRWFELGAGASRLGHPVARWFPAAGPRRLTLHYRAATQLVVAAANMAGARSPRPSYLPPNDFTPVAEWIAGQRAQGIACVLTGLMSPIVRVAGAALDRGIDIGGTLLLGGGEALTPAKRAVAEAAGAGVFSRYHITEVGNIGHSCRQMQSGNSVHVFTDSVAAIAYDRQAPLSGTNVSSLLLTTLLPSAPRVLINVEMDDGGVIDEARCDCAFTRAGLTTVIHDLASFGKLTGHGVTLVGSDIVAVLEARLPARLGGRVGDFQLVEIDTGRQTQVELRVSPRVPAHADVVRQCFLDELRLMWGGRQAVGLWRHAEAIRVVAAEPLAGRTGKILPLHLLGGSHGKGMNRP